MNLIGEKVNHNRFGEGVVVGQSEGKITVAFGGSVRSFVYPDVFDLAMTAVASEMQAQIRSEAQAVKQGRESIQTDKVQQMLGSLKVAKTVRATLDKSIQSIETAMSGKNNLAFKCNFCDGGMNVNGLGFSHVCNRENIRFNILGRQYEYCVKGPLCRAWLDGKITYSDLSYRYVEGEIPCSDSAVLNRWRMFAQSKVNNSRKERERSLRAGGNLAVLTTRQPQDEEKDRYIFGVFIMGGYELIPGEAGGDYYALDDYHLALTPDEARSMKFWNYYRNQSNPEHEQWGSGLYRCLSDGDAARILRDIVHRRRGMKNIAPAQRLFDEYCRTHPGVLEYLEEYGK